MTRLACKCLCEFVGLAATCAALLGLLLVVAAALDLLH